MLTQLQLENFKSWEDTGQIALKPITGFFGPNSSGKTSLFQALLMMKQTAESPDRGLALHFGNEKTLVALGDFESVIHRHETERNLRISLGWKSKRQFAIPDVYGNGTVAEGDDIGFEVEIGETTAGGSRMLTTRKMSYQIAVDRRFGLRRLADDLATPAGLTKYEVSAYGSTFDGFDSSLRFHDFPFTVRRQPRSEDLFFDLTYGLDVLLVNLHYLGPRRADPHRIYSWSGAEPLNMGTTGEFVVDALLTGGGSHKTFVDPNIGFVNIEEYAARWLKLLGLIEGFRVEPVAPARRIFEVKVQQSRGSPEVLLADVGFGVSQILPVIVLCFYVPEKSTVILDHPDIHLHPLAQAGLADVFIEAWQKHGVQILFESHSEHLLRRLQRRIAENEIGNDDVSLFFCSTNDTGASTLSRLEVDEFGNVSNWPRDFFGDQFGEIAAMTDAALARQGDAS